VNSRVEERERESGIDQPLVQKGGESEKERVCVRVCVREIYIGREGEERDRERGREKEREREGGGEERGRGSGREGNDHPPKPVSTSMRLVNLATIHRQVMSNNKIQSQVISNWQGLDTGYEPFFGFQCREQATSIREWTTQRGGACGLGLRGLGLGDRRGV